jgi:hypothetical protein
MKDTTHHKSRCLRCGRRLKRGGHKYRLSMEVYADFDGTILDEDESLEQMRRQLEEYAEGKTAKELEEEVFLKIEGLLCVECRDEVVGFVRGEESGEES